MIELFRKINALASLDVPIYIEGASGSGKELVARALHYNGKRAAHRFCAVNCAAIPENLLESVLFGHRRGAFTSAISDQMGEFEAAHNGTLFLDEISEMPFSLQAKLLRVLQDKQVKRVGDTKSEEFDVRVVVASNKDLEKEMEQGRLRGDLYYRLNVIPLSLPLLGERREDIPLLATSFIRKYTGINGDRANVMHFTPAAVEKLRSNPWPGNIRQLENVIQRAIILMQNGVIDAKDIVFTSKEFRDAEIRGTVPPAQLRMETGGQASRPAYTNARLEVNELPKTVSTSPSKENTATKTGQEAWYHSEGGIVMITSGALNQDREAVHSNYREHLLLSDQLFAMPISMRKTHARTVYYPTPLSLPKLFHSESSELFRKLSQQMKEGAHEKFVAKPFMVANPASLSQHEGVYSRDMVNRIVISRFDKDTIIETYRTEFTDHITFVVNEAVADLFIPKTGASRMGNGTWRHEKALEGLQQAIQEYYAAFLTRRQPKFTVPLRA